MPPAAVKRTGFKPKSLLGLSISLLIWQPPGWADTLASALPQLNADSTPQVGFDTQVEGNKLTVNQSADKVILNWDSFNIGEQNAVHFQQVANGIALNRILDQAPSQILGSLTATGSIYLLNPNGVLFGQNSQVHVGNLLVSTQQVDTEQFLQSNIFNSIDKDKPSLTAPGQAQGSIDIEKGAHISTDSGGSVLVFAPSITNAGSIRTPDGQTVLAASSDKVYLTSSDQDPDLRGVFVEVGTGGDVTNLGEIVAERGNVTLLGLAVNQAGRVRATSSVDVNGTIRLLARDGATLETLSDATPEQLLAAGVDQKTELHKSTTSKVALSKHTGDLPLGANSLTQVSLEQPPQAVLVDDASLSAAAVAQLKSLAGSKSVDIKDAAGQAFKGLAVTPAAYAQWQQGQSDSPRRVRVLSAEGYIDQLAADRIQGATAVDASVQNPSKIELYGKHIELGED
ncbi:MAG TPA: filamentous hemagglutinin N-terminal domain-containing protein, partial [Cellvibrionaceae bacterium]|nr:filamentous hemagglutinin N-terminal domain-containing protein [Cellvibrionaceae bacterium]